MLSDNFSEIEKVVARVACFYAKKYEREYGCIFSFGSTNKERVFELCLDVDGPTNKKIPIPREFGAKRLSMRVCDYKGVSFSVRGFVCFRDILKVYRRLLKRGLVQSIKKWNYVRVI